MGRYRWGVFWGLPGGTLPVGVFGIGALLAPWSYTIRSDAIVVNRLGPAVVLRFEQIRAIQRIDSAEIGFVPGELLAPAASWAGSVGSTGEESARSLLTLRTGGISSWSR